MNTAFILSNQIIFWLALFVVLFIEYNQEKHLLASLWWLSETQCKYPVDNNARKKYHINIDSATIYPPTYVELMEDTLECSPIVAVNFLCEYAPKAGIHTDIIRGEDRYLALQLKQCSERTKTVLEGYLRRRKNIRMKIVI